MLGKSKAKMAACDDNDILNFFTKTEQAKIKRLYLDECMIIKEVAKVMGVRYKKIQDYLKAIGATRTSKESQITGRARRSGDVETTHAKALRLIGATR